MGTLRFPDGLNEQQFLDRFWQKGALLLPSALIDFRCPLTPEELAGLACEEGLESRLVLERGGPRPWQVRHGPFSDHDFLTLPESHWTLLVQDVDKFVPQVAELLDYFRFIPGWRVDDVMVSFAADRGSVGPHLDDYDVFLVQAHGRRRWQIQDQPAAGQTCLPDLDLRILPTFTPNQDWILEPGDVLYLPPRRPHWGVAMGDCMTFSVGFRAPSDRELLAAWCDDVISHDARDDRYSDPNLEPQEYPGEIRPAVFERVRARLDRIVSEDPGTGIEWFGRLITETKENLAVAPHEQPLNPEQFLADYREHGVLRRHLCARLAFARDPSRATAYLFANGEVYHLALEYWRFLAVITNEHIVPWDTVDEFLKNRDCLSLLTQLYNDGYFEFLVP